MTNNHYKLLEILEAYLLLKSRIYLDKKRNQFFLFIDKNSKKLDDAANTRLKKFDMSQYAQFRDITEMGRLNEYGVRLETRQPITENKTRQIQFTDDDPWTFDEEEYY